MKDDCCYNCKYCCALERWDYSGVGKGEWKTLYDGYACVLFAMEEGEVIHMVGENIRTGMCEMFTPRNAPNPFEKERYRYANVDEDEGIV